MNNIVILAAGCGKRFNCDIPKCAFVVNDKPMVLNIMEKCNKINNCNKICVVGYKKEVIKDILKDSVKYVYQKEQLGTAHALFQVKEYMQEEGYTLVIPGDVGFIDEKSIHGVINAHLKDNNDITIGTMKLNNPYGYGRIYKKNNKIIKIIEEKNLKKNQKKIKLVNSGIICIDNKMISDLEKLVCNNNEYYLTDLISCKNIKIKDVLIDNLYARGINDLKTLYKISKKINKRKNLEYTKNGVNIIDINTTYISDNVTIKQGCTIYPNTYITGNTIIEENCIIKNSTINNCKIGKSVVITSSQITDSNILQDTTIGPYAVIREHSEIGKNCRIGNFVEIKKSSIGDFNKIAHHSYIGDTLSKNNVNFGCGCITANYDGVNKHQTIIEDNVFIGSNVNLIAPIIIKRNSFLAAGSTICKDVEENKLVIERSMALIKEKYNKC